MALAWKAGWVNSPQGFESPILRHHRLAVDPVRLCGRSTAAGRPYAGPGGPTQTRAVDYFEVGKWKLASLSALLRGHRAVTTLARV
jgi:hypothetical protein